MSRMILTIAKPLKPQKNKKETETKKTTDITISFVMISGMGGVYSKKKIFFCVGFVFMKKRSLEIS